MKIAIIGAGNVGRALATGWRKAIRDPTGAGATELKQQGFTIAAPKDAAARAEPAEAGSLANPPYPTQPFRSKAKPKFLPSFCTSASLIHTIAIGSR